MYVDLDNDYSFADEKPVSKQSPASYRDLDGDGYTDLSGGLLHHISDGTTPLPGGPDAFGVLQAFAPGQMLAWSGDYDPAIGGHGTLTASNVAGQGVINGLAPTFKDMPKKYGNTYPGAVIGGAPHAKLAPFGDIYFSFEFSTQLGYFLTTSRGVDVTSNSYGSSEVDNDGWDGASQEADVIHDGGSHDAGVLDRATARPASAPRRPRARPQRSQSAPRPSSAPPAGIRSRRSTRSSTTTSWCGRTAASARPGPRCRCRSRRCILGRRRHAEHGAGRVHCVGHLGRHEPLDAGRRRGDGARLPGL